MINGKNWPRLSLDFLGKITRLGLAIDYSMLRPLTEGV